MKHVNLSVSLYDGNHLIFDRHDILVREDWVPQMVNRFDEVDVSQCIRDEDGRLVFVYPDEDNVHYFCRTKRDGEVMEGDGYTIKIS